MQYSRWGDWSYNKHNNNGSNRICTVYNNEGKQVLLKSITLYLGIAKSGTSANWGESVTGNGGSVTFYLSTSYNSPVNSSTSNTIDSPLKGTYTSSSNTSLRTYYTDNMTQYTFSFGNGILMNDKDTLNFYYVRTSGDNVIVCPKDGNHWDGYQYSTQNVTGVVTDPYTAPTYSINSITSIGKLDETDYTVKYTIKDGTASTIDWVKARIYSSTGTHLKDITIKDEESKGTDLSGTFKLSKDSFNHESQYKVSIRFSDNTKEYETSQLITHTYRVPTLQNVKLSYPDFSSTGNSTLYWDTNNRRWGTELEKNFKTYLKLDSEGKWFEASDHSPLEAVTSTNTTSVSQNLNRQFITTHFTTEQLKQDSISTNLTVRRKNESSGVCTDVSVPITIQNRPKYKVSNAAYYDDNTNASINPGSIVYIEKCPKVRVEWTYPSDADGGYINGYIVRIYKDSDTSAKPYNSFKIVTNDLTASYVFNIKDDLYRGSLNYITIEAYYSQPETKNDMKGPVFSQQFIKPLSLIEKPVISYPITNTTWHNHNFRILFKLPKDGDYNTYDQNIKTNYSYNQVQVSINDKIYTYTDNNDMFSTNALRHNINICLNPSITSGFITKDTYKIKVRVQRKYYEKDWSDWSDEVLLRISPITDLAVSVGQIIEASHYNRVRNYSYRLWQVYPISSLPTNNIEAKAKETKILQSHYVDIYKTITNIQSDVNKWAVYDSDRDEIKFNQTITELSNPNQPISEYVTSVADNRPNPNGRNYMRILVSCMNKLF